MGVFGRVHQAPLLFLPAMEGQEEGPEDVPELEKLEEVEVPPTSMGGGESQESEKGRINIQIGLSWSITISFFETEVSIYIHQFAVYHNIMTTYCCMTLRRICN